jgi:glycosyltransferase involved in cell wall biosynthesis
LNILQISASYKPAYVYGGPTMSVSELSEQLNKAGCTVNVFTTTANGTAELDIEANVPLTLNGVTVTYFNRITKDHSHFSPAILKAVWKNVKKFDVVHIHAWWNLVSVLSCLIALMRGRIVVLSPRGTLSAYSFQNKNIGLKQLLHGLLGKYLLNKCHLHATSQQEKTALVKLIDTKNITVLPNFVKLQPQKKRLKSQPGSVFKLLFFSRIEEKKGLEILLNALKTVTEPYHLTIAGSGRESYIDSLKALVKNNLIEDKITWAGFYGDDKFDRINEHDLFVLPSYDENFGNTVIESLSVGTPVLISEQVGLADYVLENDLGWVCQTNPQSVSDAINNIMKDNRGKLREINEKAPGIIYNDFYEDELVSKYITFYKQAITA